MNMSPRIMQGASITLGWVGNLGRALAELGDEEVAYVVGRYMWENAASGIDPRGRVFAGSVGRALQDLWSGQNTDNKNLRDRLTRHLRAHGFNSVQHGPGLSGFAGWLVPAELVWDAPERVRPPKPDEPMPPPEPVRTSYQCPECGAAAANADRLRDHRGRKHGVFSPTAYNTELLAAIVAKPGLAPRMYAKRLNRSAAAVSKMCGEFAAAGLIVITGTRSAARYAPLPAAEQWLADNPHPQAAARTARLGPAQVRLLDVLRQYPGLQAYEYDQLMERGPGSSNASLQSLEVQGHVHRKGRQWYLGRGNAHARPKSVAGRRSPKPDAPANPTPPMPMLPPPPPQPAPERSAEARQATLVGNVLVVDGKTYVIREMVEVK